MSRLFRPAALNKVSSPDQLDRVLQVVRPIHGLGIAAIALVVIAGFAWSVLSTAPIKVQGRGILLSAEGVAAVSSPNEGRVEQISIRPGDMVHEGQAVAMLKRPAALDATTAKEAELDGARKLLQERRGAHALNQRMQDALLRTKRRTLTERLEKMLEQYDALARQRDKENAVPKKSAAASARIAEINAQMAELESRMATVRNESTELLLRQRTDETQKNQEIREAGLRVQSLERELHNLEREYERSRSVIAPVAGTVVELSVNPGDQVGTGQTIMRLLPADPSGKAGALHAIVFVENEDGKKVKEGMSAQIMPSTTKPQKDGFIRGTVLTVAKIPSSREGIMRRLNNATLVDSLLKTGAPFEIELALQANPAAPSGYQWSSGMGPDLSIDAGTIASADMVVDHRHVISLVLPFFDNIFRWLGVH
ncbi:MAG: NHLP bacteriocin system secretion protein [Burkholderiaceae bacterium]